MGRSIIVKDELLDVDIIGNLYYESKTKRTNDKDDNKLEKTVQHVLSVRFVDNMSFVLQINGFESKEEVLSVIKQCHNLKNCVPMHTPIEMSTDAEINQKFKDFGSQYRTKGEE